jgi:DNA-binding LytR/AlgR family response regulator
MNVLIAHSEKEQSDRLADIIHQQDSNINILAKTSSLKETLSFFNQKGPDIDLTFLGVAPISDSSFESLNQYFLSGLFVLSSSNMQDAYQAIKANSLDFLMEPFNAKEVSMAIIRARKRWTAIREENRKYKKRFMIKVGDRIIYKTTEDISYIFAEGKMAYIVTRGTSRRYIIENTLDELEKKCLDPAVFYRVNRKFIVNINAIEEARNYVNSRLKLVLDPPTDFDMIVSREKVTDFKNWLNL